MKYLEFRKTNNTEWYIVLPDYPGDISDLQMVCGADTFLDLLSEGDDNVTLTVSLTPFDFSDTLEKVRDDADLGGAHYILNKYNQTYEMWLCAVTEFVLGYMPEKIYFTKAS